MGMDVVWIWLKGKYVSLGKSIERVNEIVFD
jgi:hypothetical protein